MTKTNTSWKYINTRSTQDAPIFEMDDIEENNDKPQTECRIQIGTKRTPQANSLFLTTKSKPNDSGKQEVTGAMFRAIISSSSVELKPGKPEINPGHTRKSFML